MRSAAQDPSDHHGPGGDAGATTGADAEAEAVLQRLLRHRILHIAAPITGETADRITAQLLLLDAEGDRPVTLYVNSLGGSLPAGMAIYDTMQHIRSDVITIGLGYCASMAQFLVAAGTPGKRYALPNTRMMLHLPSFVDAVAADSEGTRIDELHYTRSRITDLIARHTGRDAEQVARDFADDRWLTPAEAKGYGLIDDTMTG
ncbi:ATP-dependent Clp protease proteolytic subunit [Streptomyces sp. NPDC126499]|uniref:ClpP family protease n=1 Tax=Streptomyces sp. NPDC126499 TaxID=3155314 RepID=UPI0033332A17